DLYIQRKRAGKCPLINRLVIVVLSAIIASLQRYPTDNTPRRAIACNAPYLTFKRLNKNNAASVDNCAWSVDNINGHAPFNPSPVECANDRLSSSPLLVRNRVKVTFIIGFIRHSLVI